MRRGRAARPSLYLSKEHEEPCTRNRTKKHVVFWGIKRAPAATRWKHTTSTSNMDLARVMLAVRDTIERYVFLSPSKDAFIFLCDSCTDTDLISIDYVKAKGLEQQINKAVRINMGTASNGSAFKTIGTIECTIEIECVNKKWHTLTKTWHVADIGKKCLVNTTELCRQGWKFVQQFNADGSAGTCMIAPDGVVFALDADSHGMPILPTRDRHVIAKSKPPTLRKLADALIHMAKYGGRQPPPSPNRRSRRSALTTEQTDSEDSTSTDTCSETDGSESDWETDEEEDAACMNTIMDDLTGSKGRSRAHKVTHTPQSWHRLMHSGRVLSEATATGSDVKFKINGKTKKGYELNSSDLAALEGARADCNICKQTKAVAASAPRGKSAGRVSFTSEKGRI